MPHAPYYDGDIEEELEKDFPDLKDADLKDADLWNADLWNADLTDAGLWNANLTDANLRNADLRNADLRNADLRNANLTDANLRNANLRNADLTDANLTDANLWNANLTDANLTDADLRNANLTDANLWNANLTDANLWNANLTDADLGHWSIVPETGCFRAYKSTEDGVVKVEIPEDSERISCLKSRKCRAEYVTVIETPDGVEEARGHYDDSVVYREGEEVWADEFDGDRRVECSNGIHFFMTCEEAEEFVM